MTSNASLTTPCDPLVQPIDEVIAWLIEGHRDADIRAAIKEKWPEHDPTQLQLAAAEHFRRAAQCEPQIIVGFAIEAYRDLYRRMVKIGDFAGAAKAVKELVALTPNVQRFKDANTDEAAEAPEAGDITAHPAGPPDAHGRRQRRRSNAGETAKRSNRRDPAVRKQGAPKTT